jgi:hypothetical protein
VPFGALLGGALGEAIGPRGALLVAGFATPVKTTPLWEVIAEAWRQQSSIPSRWQHAAMPAGARDDRRVSFSLSEGLTPASRGC